MGPLGKSHLNSYDGMSSQGSQKKTKTNNSHLSQQKSEVDGGIEKFTVVDQSRYGRFADDMTAEQCFEKMEKLNTDLKIGDLELVKGIRRDLFNNILPLNHTVISYNTSGIHNEGVSKNKTINADRIQFQDPVTKNVHETKFIRSQFPEGVYRKKFLSWILSVSQADPEAKPYILNLLRENEQGSTSTNSSSYKRYYSTDTAAKESDDDDDEDRSSGAVSVRSHLDEGTVIDVSTEDLKKNDGLAGLNTYTLTIKKRDSKKKEIGKTSCLMKNFTRWPDSGVVNVTTLNCLVDELIYAKSEKNNPIVIHCRAGRGRKGTIITAAILKEAIKNKTIEIKLPNYKEVVCHLVMSLREGGGSFNFVQTIEQLDLLFEFTKTQLKNP